MTAKLNKKTLEYLCSLKLTENTRIIITNLETTLFDSNINYDEKINVELLKYLLLNSSINAKQLTKNKTINIFENNTLNEKSTSQIILPINTKSKNIQDQL